jgi:hypothetical protein
MIWKLAAGSAMMALVLVAAVVGANKFTEESQWDRLAGSHRFNILRWESENLLAKWSHFVREAFRDSHRSESDRVRLVHEYVDLQKEIASLTTQAERKGTDRELLAHLTGQRDEMEDRVEEVVEGQISGILADQGLSRTLWLGSEAHIVFPPVDFEFASRPNVLIVSRRDRVEIVDTSLLVPDMTLDEKVALEAKVDRLGQSALVEQVGAVATYPSIVPPTSSLENLLSKVAHEWMHHYLFFRPLGQNYWSSYEMTTINETVANIAGDEIAALTYDHYYNGAGEQPSTSQQGNTTSLDFGKAMRETRVTIDELLTEGRIEEAEHYMDERRQFLEDNGYYLRKLNQAYFAFHGSYADTPTSVSPIGDQLREMRERSPSVGDFIRSAAAISSYDSLQESLANNAD